MLKKVGIVAATVTAGLLAVSPLAFAGDGGGDKGDHHRGGPDQVNLSDSSRNSSQTGLVNVGDINALNNVAVCPPIDANVAASVLGILGGPATNNDGSGAEGSCSAGDTLNQLNNK